MDAYNAYYNNHEQEDDHGSPVEGLRTVGSPGVNINITAGGNCQNNFIFNHTAPINLNFYKDGGQNSQTAALADAEPDSGNSRPPEQAQKQPKTEK